MSDEKRLLVTFTIHCAGFRHIIPHESCIMILHHPLTNKSQLDGRVVDGREIMVQFAKYGPNAERISKGRSRSRSPRPRIGCGAAAAPAEVAAADDDDNLDLFGDETEEEKKDAEQREAAKATTKKKESGKSLVLLDVKPWDDETDMKKVAGTFSGEHVEAIDSTHVEGTSSSIIENVTLVVSEKILEKAEPDMSSPTNNSAVPPIFESVFSANGEKK
ncbi:hypothetical protein ACS0TY_022681 [Phlomoides rotata]